MNNNLQLKTYLIKTLIKYLNKYIKKDFYMNNVFVVSKKSLKKHQSITTKQFNFIFKFLQREKAYRYYNKIQIYNYFAAVIDDEVIDDEPIIEKKSLLENYMTDET